ncbi:MAG: hypothetical protein JWQ38_2791 [Flavipsychrobacter sp.]|nr:hypothetical protein [Flavipsychrobacter sp.]
MLQLIMYCQYLVQLKLTFYQPGIHTPELATK